MYLHYRDTALQHVNTNNVFHTPGVYYRPAELKSMRCLLGNTEVRTIYQNFELLNLNINSPDRSHHLYTRYLQTQKFIPPGDVNYFEHSSTNNVPTEPSKTEGKGAFNVFALSLTSDELDRTSSSSLGKNKKNKKYLVCNIYILYFYFRSGQHQSSQVRN
jgi:hypothetical protein